MYEWLKAAHIVSVIAWMAGLLYLPRLFVYHASAPVDGEASRTFMVMERRLMKVIMTPAMAASWTFGLWLAWMSNAWPEAWFQAKLSLLALLSAFHALLAAWMSEFARNERRRGPRFYRLVNEFPTLVMIAIVILVIVRPF